jgi:hypothetical protein
VDGDIAAGLAEGGRKEDPHPVAVGTKQAVGADDNSPRDGDVDQALRLLEEWEDEGDQDGREEKGHVKCCADHYDDHVEDVIAVEAELAGVLHCCVDLPVEPAQAGENKCHAKEPDECERNEWQTASPQEPAGGRDDDEDAQPAGLAGGPEERVGYGGGDEPCRGLRRHPGLDGAKAEVEAEDDDEDAGDVRHEAERERDKQRGEHEGEGCEGGVCFAQAHVHEGPLQQEGSSEGDQQDGGISGGEGESKDPNEESAQGELPSQHCAGPAEVGEVAGLCKCLCGTDIGEVVVLSHLHERVGDEGAEGEKQRAKGRGVLESTAEKHFNLLFDNIIAEG